MAQPTDDHAPQPAASAPAPVCVITPTYREAPNLPELIERLENVRALHGTPHELVIIDDDSDDDPASVLRALDRPWVRLIVRTGERDLSTAVLHAIDATSAQTIVVMDADLSHPPERIPDLLAALDAGADVALGSRRVPGASTDEQWGMRRRLTSRLASLLIGPLTSARDPTSGFFAFRRPLLERATSLRPTGYKIGLELLVRTRCTNVREVPIHFAERHAGTSKLSVRQGLRFLEHLRRLYAFSAREALLRPGRPGQGRLAPAPTTPSARWAWALATLAIVGVTLGVFAPAIGFEFLGYDDRFHIHENQALLQPGPDRFTRFWAEPYGALYVPLAYNLFAIEAIAADRGPDTRPDQRFDPRVFHAMSVALHAGACVLVLLVLRSLGAPALGAFAGASIFALHPLQVEAVGWISEQRGLLAALLALGASLAYLRSTRAERAHPSLVGIALGAILFAGAVLAKPSAAPLPLALMVIDILIRRVPLTRTLARLAPWLALGLALLIVTRLLQQPDADRQALALWTRPLIAGDAAAFYLAKLVVPLGLSPDHGRTPGAVLAGVWVWLAWLAPALLAALLIVRRASIGLAALGVFLAMLAPVLGLVSFHHQEISTVADRYAYLAMLGPALIAAAIIARLPRRPAIALVLTLGAAMALASRAQLSIWRSDVSLWTHTLGVNPRSALAHNNLGYHLYEQGQAADAMTHYERALELDPTLDRVRTNAGVALRDLGRPSDAEAMLRSAIEHDPRDVRALTALGVVLAQRADRAGAASLFRRALDVAPDDAQALGNLGLTLMESGDPREAERLYRRALESDPWFAEAWHNLGVVLRRTDRTDEAIEAWRRALECDPALAPTHRVLGAALIDRADLDAAEHHLREAIRLDPTNAGAHNNLGLIATRRANLDEAIRCFAEAVRLDPTMETARRNLENAKSLRDQEREVRDER